MNELALFAGAGGGLLGSLLLGWKPICAVEKEPYCREVLLRRQRDGMLPLFPIWDDIRTFDGRPWCGLVDVITAGFPCQPWSVAGRREGETDARNLWPETIRVICEVEPQFCLLENVPGLLGAHGYFGRILGDLAEGGFDACWDCIPASAVGANHQRDRVWILANPNSQRFKNVQGGKKDAESPRKRTTRDTSWWDIEPNVGRVAYGVAFRVDRLRALGNGQVPGVVEKAWNRLIPQRGF
jgi:DNA (cytosine-5)-methyltransferase 1